MEILQDKIKELSEAKAAVEAANVELQRQNQYYQELFAKQQEKLLRPQAVQQPLSPLHNQSSGMTKRFSGQESLEISQQTQELSNIDEGRQSVSDLSYEDLEMDFAEFTKRQKCNDDSFYGNSSQKAPRNNLPLMRNISFEGNFNH